VRRKIIAVTILAFLAGCTTLHRMPMPAAPKQTLFILFFVPGTTRLAPEAEAIVRQAAGIALESKVTKIEIAVPQDTPGGVSLVEGRFTSVQNILSAAHVDTKLLTRANLAADAESLPGATDRAEVRLLP